MKLIQELDSKNITSKTGKIRKRHFGLFICPKCNETVKKELYGGYRALSCGNKTCVDRHPEIAKTPQRESIYNSWAGMKQRCNNKNGAKWADYGGRGITYSSNWETYEGFLVDMEKGWKQDLEIDRINKNGNYEVTNCQWLTKKENCAKDIRRPVSKYDMQDNHIITYSSLKAAVEAGEALRTSSIGRVALGQRKHYKGFKWRYATETPFRVKERKQHPLKGTSNKNDSLYYPWANMISRYRDLICEEWTDFIRFKKDMNEGYFTDAHLIRKMVTGLFTKDNCKWVTKAESSSLSKSKITKQIDKITGRIVKEWSSARQAGIALKIDPSSIAKVCNGKKKSAGGFLWQN